MVARIAVVALNTYREAVRARMLHGLFGLAVATALYALAVGSFALRDAVRVTSDLGAASVSLYAILTAVVLGATSLYRELEHKTIFPVLTRPLRRAEYLVGKFFGTLITLVTFVVGNLAVLLLVLAGLGGRDPRVLAAVLAASVGLAVLVAFLRPRLRTWLPMFWGAGLLLAAVPLADVTPADRRLVLAAGALSIFEAAIVAGVATLFSSFSSPFLTALLTVGCFLVGRSADTLARLPPKVFGQAIHDLGVALSRVVPNLMVYVPARALLTGEVLDPPLGRYLLLAGLQALGWCVILLALGSVIFRRRDFP